MACQGSFDERNVVAGLAPARSLYSHLKVRIATSSIATAQITNVTREKNGKGALLDMVAWRACVSAAAGRICAIAANAGGRWLNGRIPPPSKRNSR